MSLLIIVLLITVVAVTVVALLWRRAQRRMAQARAQAAWLNRELERTDSQLEAVEIWSDEQIERNDRELGDSILERVGRDLAADASPEAGRLRAFLAKVHPPSTNKEQSTPEDLGRAWFACLQILDKDPASELAQLFKALNDAWTATREGQAQP
jgi:hypothetical protein